MLYCDAATFCRRRNDAGIMTDETGRRCAQESIDIIIMKNKYYYLFIIKIILITYLLFLFLPKYCVRKDSVRYVLSKPKTFELLSKAFAYR